MSDVSGVEVDEEEVKSDLVPRLKIVDNGWNYSYQGLFVDLYPNPKGFLIQLGDGGKKIQVPVNATIASIDFGPKGFDYIPGNDTEVLVKGLASLRKFLDIIENYRDKQNKPLRRPLYLFGNTNPRMARFAERVGFKIAKMFEDNTLYTKLKNRVVGRLSGANDPDANGRLAHIEEPGHVYILTTIDQLKDYVNKLSSRSTNGNSLESKLIQRHEKLQSAKNTS